MDLDFNPDEFKKDIELFDWSFTTARRIKGLKHFFA